MYNRQFKKELKVLIELVALYERAIKIAQNGPPGSFTLRNIIAKKHEELKKTKELILDIEEAHKNK